MIWDDENMLCLYWNFREFIPKGPIRSNIIWREIYGIIMFNASWVTNNVRNEMATLPALSTMEYLTIKGPLN